MTYSVYKPDKNGFYVVIADPNVCQHWLAHISIVLISCNEIKNAKSTLIEKTKLGQCHKYKFKITDNT